MSYRQTIGVLFQNYFGIAAARYAVETTPAAPLVKIPLDTEYQPQEPGETLELEVLDIQEGYYQTPLGTPVFDYITVLKEGKEIYRFPFAITTEVSRRFVIEETPLVGRKETVKEFISSNGFRINIRGFIIPEGEFVPKNEIKAMHNILETGDTLEIVSPHLNNLGIHYLVVDSYKFPPYPGSFTQPFELRCKSDEPYFVEDL